MNDVYIDDSILDPNEYDQIVFDDGKILIHNSDSESEQDPIETVEDWISKNDVQLYNLYKDSQEFDLIQCSYSDFCEYLYYGEHSQYSDIDVWISEMNNYKYNLSGLQNPSVKEFAAHYYSEIICIYTYLENNSSFCIGPVEDFIDFLHLLNNSQKLK